MKYLYHKVPPQQSSYILYPLNRLKDIDQNLYKLGVKKYEGRPKTQKQNVPILNVLWNDVIHLSPVDIKDIKDQLDKLESHFECKYYKIPIENIDIEKAVVYMYQHEKLKDKFLPENWKKLSEVNFNEISKLTQRTIDYYTKATNEDQRVFLFHTIPHVLYLGEIDTRGLEIIDLSN